MRDEHKVAAQSVRIIPFWQILDADTKRQRPPGLKHPGGRAKSLISLLLLLLSILSINIYRCLSRNLPACLTLAFLSPLP